MRYLAASLLTMTLLAGCKSLPTQSIPASCRDRALPIPAVHKDLGVYTTQLMLQYGALAVLRNQCADALEGE